MKKKKEERIPLSGWAKGEMSGNYFHYFGLTIIGSAIVGFFWLILCTVFLVCGKITNFPNTPWTFKKFLFWIMVFVLPASFILLTNWILVAKRYKRRKREIIVENETDYQQSLRLRPALNEVSSVSVSDFPVIEREVTGTWKPFRIEHFLSDSIRSQIIGQTKLKLSPFGATTIRGVSHSVATPNLLDSSSILFLRNSAGGTLRALIPSPKTTREIIIGAMERWFSDTPADTHTRVVLEECSFLEENVVVPISHPSLIDLLDSSCEENFGQRPNVGVMGQEIQEGVVIATALKVDGKKSIFLPTGFFRQLAETISFAVQNVLPAPTVIEAVKPT